MRLLLLHFCNVHIIINLSNLIKEHNMTIGERIKDRRKELGIRAEDLAYKLGVSRSTIFRWENGDIEKVPANFLSAIASSLNVSQAYLMGWSDDVYVDIPKLSKTNNIRAVELRHFPLIGKIAAGQPIYAEEDFESFVEAGANIKADFCLEVQGDSMINARINDGDIVFIRKQSIVEDGQIAAVIIDDEATLKRVYIQNNQIMLVAENPSYKPMIFRGEELDHIRIIGKAVWFMGKI
jgi:repressor LexA